MDLRQLSAVYWLEKPFHQTSPKADPLARPSVHGSPDKERETELHILNHAPMCWEKKIRETQRTPGQVAHLLK